MAFSQKLKYGVGTALLVLGAGANAAAIDVADIVTDIGAQAGPVAAIGGAVLVLLVGVKAFRWVRQAMS